MVEIKLAFNKRTYELWVDGLLIIQCPKLDKIMDIGIDIVDKHGYNFKLNI